VREKKEREKKSFDMLVTNRTTRSSKPFVFSRFPERYCLFLLEEGDKKVCHSHPGMTLLLPQSRENDVSNWLVVDLVGWSVGWSSAIVSGFIRGEI
jgi:hypothetical protein